MPFFNYYFWVDYVHVITAALLIYHAVIPITLCSSRLAPGPGR